MEGFEKFLENTKVLINLTYRIRGRADRYPGIYQAEKDKAVRLLQQFKFKDKIKYIRERVEAVEAKYLPKVEETVGIQSAVAQG